MAARDGGPGLGEEGRRERSYLAATHRRYGKPIWLTEFALIDFSGGPRYPTDAQQAAFVTGAARMLEDLPYVQGSVCPRRPTAAPASTTPMGD